jgi:hypothetical protein
VCSQSWTMCTPARNENGQGNDNGRGWGCRAVAPYLCCDCVRILGRRTSLSEEQQLRLALELSEKGMRRLDGSVTTKRVWSR